MVDVFVIGVCLHIWIYVFGGGMLSPLDAVYFPTDSMLLGYPRHPFPSPLSLCASRLPREEEF